MSSSDTDLAVANADEYLEESSSRGSIEHNLETIEGGREIGSSTRLYQGDSAAAALASQQVGSNHDILPLILDHLKDGPARVWKKALVPLLVVNRSFFQCGADLLWNAMDSLVPVYWLLPWYQGLLGAGIGSHIYRSAVDWQRFETYASRIKSFKIDSMQMPTVWVLQLSVLPGRPDPLFPALQAISFGPTRPRSKNSTILSILVGPNLRCLHVEEDNPVKLSHSLSALPMLSASSPGLASIKISGPLAVDCLVQLSQLTSITSLELILTNNFDSHHLRHLRHLPLLNSLSISAPLFTIVPPSTFLEDQSLEAHGQLALAALDVKATLYQQALIAKAISPRNLRSLSLPITLPFNPGFANEFIYCLGQYAAANPSLSELLVNFTSGSTAATVVTARVSIPTLAQAASDLRWALRRIRIQSLRIYGIPLSTASPTSMALLQSMPWYKSTITTLSLRVALPGDVIQGTHDSHTFSGLSVLASRIWKHCPNLEELEYHFDKGLVELEDLSGPAASCEGSFGGHHRLRSICINTGSTIDESKQLELSMSRKIEISTFLDDLFPALEVIEGSASDVWDGICKLVMAFQDRRARSRFETRVDGELS